MVFPEPGMAMTASAFGTRLRELLEARGMSYRALSARTYYGKSYVHDLATGRKPQPPPTAETSFRPC